MHLLYLPSAPHDRCAFSRTASLLEGKDLVLELADRARLVVAEGLGGLLEATDHRGRAADEDLDVVRRLGEPLLLIESVK